MGKIAGVAASQTHNDESAFNVVLSNGWNAHMHQKTAEIIMQSFFCLSPPAVEIKAITSHQVWFSPRNIFVDYKQVEEEVKRRCGIYDIEVEVCSFTTLGQPAFHQR